LKINLFVNVCYTRGQTPWVYATAGKSGSLSGLLPTVSLKGTIR